VVKAKPGDFPRSAEEMAASQYNAIAPFRYELFPTGQDIQQDGTILFLNNVLGIYPTALTRIGQLPPFTIPRLSDERAGSQGQWGMALRYFADVIRTEFGAYYIRIHDKRPSVGYVVEPADLVIRTYINAEEWGPFANATAAQLGGFGWRLADTTLASAAVPVGYFAEYPEGINIFGLSAATELFGIAWGAEVSYQNRLPVPIDGELTLRNLILEVTETGQRTKRSGFIREERWQAQLNAIATLGPGDAYVGAIVRALHISSIAVTLEAALVKFPSLDSDVFYQPTNSGGQMDDLSWGYQTLITGFYDNPFGVPVTLTPRIGFAHDVYGNTPGFYPFIEARKSFSAGVNLDYLGVWQFDLSYTNSFGAGAANMDNDRDFVAASVTYSF
jgi:hypothetical protein